MKKEDNKESKESKKTKKQDKIKQENIEKMEKKIEENKKISSIHFEKIKKLVFVNVIIAIVIVLYFFIINYTLVNHDMNLNNRIFKAASLLIGIISIILFEISYKKDSGYIFLHAFEIFIISFITVYIINIYVVNIKLYNSLILYLPLAITIYYLIKALIIYNKIRKEDLKQKNDISQIVKKGR